MRISDWSSDVCSSDLFESLRRGEHLTDFVPDTICDGLRGTLGAPDLALLSEYRVAVLTVEDPDTIAATRLLWLRMKLLDEQSSAIPAAMVPGTPNPLVVPPLGAAPPGGNGDADDFPYH